MKHIMMTTEDIISQIADIYPRALSSYFIVLFKANNGQQVINRQEIVCHHCRSWTKFKNDMRALSRLFIIQLFDDGDSISFSLTEEI